MNLADCHIDKSWTLFLDRDGVINCRIIDDYVKSPVEFVFCAQVPEAISRLNQIFGRIIIVTNQQGIGKKVMTKNQLKKIHAFMLNEIEKMGGRVDAIYFCPELAETKHPDRKPKIGMALQAKQDFPEIDFSKSIMVGDSQSDMEFGKNAGMKTVFVKSKDAICDKRFVDFECNSLSQFADLLKNNL